MLEGMYRTDFWRMGRSSGQRMNKRMCDFKRKLRVRVEYTSGTGEGRQVEDFGELVRIKNKRYCWKGRKNEEVLEEEVQVDKYSR